MSDHLGGYPSLFHLSPTDVVQRAARVVQPLLREHQLREAEVADLHVEQVLIAQNVLRLTLTPTTHTDLDVTVNDPHRVHVRQTVRQRIDDLERLLLRQNRAPADVRVQLAAAQQLHHDVHFLRVRATRGNYVRRLKRLHQRYDVLVLHQRQNRDLRLNQTRLLLRLTRASLAHLRQLRLVDHLHREVLPRLLLHTLPLTPPLFTYSIHIRETPFANALTNVVVVLDAPHARHVRDRFDPLRLLRLRRAEKHLVVCRGELDAEAEILRILGVAGFSSRHSTHRHPLAHHRLLQEVHVGGVLGVRRVEHEEEVVVHARETVRHRVEARGLVQLAGVLLHLRLHIIGPICGVR